MEKNISIEITFKEILEKLWRAKWFILGVTILAAVATFGVSSMKVRDTYSQETTLYVVPKNGAGEENPIQYTQVADVAAYDLKFYLQSPDIANRIKQAMPEVGQLDGVVTISKTSTARVVSFNVKGNTSEEVSKMVQVILDAINTHYKPQMNVANIENWSTSSKPVHNGSESSVKRVVIMSALAFLVSIVLVVLATLVKQLLVKTRGK